jgi:hypothetical protein
MGPGHPHEAYRCTAPRHPRAQHIQEAWPGLRLGPHGAAPLPGVFHGPGTSREAMANTVHSGLLPLLTPPVGDHGRSHTRGGHLEAAPRHCRLPDAGRDLRHARCSLGFACSAACGPKQAPSSSQRRKGLTAASRAARASLGVKMTASTVSIRL